ncbi:MAG: hypothetical protein IT430_08090 [Phycisphaerales bacterium]|nr:hypothetical protein [Phycisphaerales bacterium]
MRESHAPPPASLALMMALCAILLCAGEAALARQCAGWSQVAQTGPGARRSHAMAYDSLRHVTLMFGGGNWLNTRHDDLWQWDGSEWTMLADGGPPARSWAGIAYDSWRDRLVIFGGSGSSTLGDTWEWDGVQWSLVAEQGPSPRVDPCMAFDARRGVTVLFGGSRSSNLYRDTWEWDGTAWKLVANEVGPPGRYSGRMVYDTVRAACMLHSGTDDTNNFRDTWSWDGAEWTLLEADGPEMPLRGATAFDSMRGVAVYFGGSANDVSTGETWEWNGQTWRRVARTGEGPFVRHESAAAYDAARQRIVLFGGGLNPGRTDYSDTWEMQPLLWVRQHPQDHDIAIGREAVFSVATTGQTPRAYRWRRDGVDLTDGGNIRGAATDTLIIRRVWPLDAAAYDVVIEGECGQIISRAAQLTVPGIALSVDASCPGGGAASVQWSNASPGGDAAILFSPSPGLQTIPGGMPCAGLQLYLDPNRLQIVWTGRSDPHGARVLNTNAGPAACGGFIQLVDLSMCVASNAARVQ